MTFYGHLLAQEDGFKEQMSWPSQAVAPCSGEGATMRPEARVLCGWVEVSSPHSLVLERPSRKCLAKFPVLFSRCPERGREVCRCAPHLCPGDKWPALKGQLGHVGPGGGSALPRQHGVQQGAQTPDVARGIVALPLQHLQRDTDDR